MPILFLMIQILKKQEQQNYVYKSKKFVSKIYQKLLRLEKRDLLQVIFYYSLNFFSLEFHLSLFYLCFFVRIHEATEGIFLVTFFVLSIQSLFCLFFAKEESSQFLFFHFFVKKKERKKTMDLFFTFLLMIPSCKLCFDDFFFFVRSFVCLLVCCNPGKTNNNNKRKVKEREKTETETKKLRHVSNDTVQCSSVLVLEVVFDGLGQV